MKDNPDTLYFSEDETHYLKSAETMIELDKEREELAKARAVSNRVTNLGFGDALRKRRGTNSIRFVYTTNANGKIFGDFYVSFFDIFFISWSKRGDGFYV